MNNSCSIPCIIVVILSLILVCCLGLCLAFVGAAAGLEFAGSSEILSWLKTSTPIAESEVTVITPLVQSPEPETKEPPEEDGPAQKEVESPHLTVTPEPTDTSITFSDSEQTLQLLKEEHIPENDMLELAMRLEGKKNIPVTLEPPASPAFLGEERTFWASNTETNENFQVTARLRYITDHLYFWIEDGVDFNERHLASLAEEFENRIYHTNREFFGSEWTPGVDSDPHLYILYASGLGWRTAGYFSSTDEYAPGAHEYSNAHEMFFLNSDAVSLNEDFTYAVLAHEFQHMIHWYRDRNETLWMNEGFSELAAFLNGYNLGGFDWSYAQDTDLQLNDWAGDDEDTTPYYGASFLFLNYFLNRFGDDATKALVAEEENGLDSIDLVLEQLNIVDPITNETTTADRLFADWAVTNFLQDESVADGRYTYQNYDDAPQPDATDVIRNCPTGEQTRDVNQYGVDYIQITCSGDYTLHFDGSEFSQVIPVDAFSGKYAFWSNKGDSSDITLTREFDFTGQTGPLTLSFRSWYDLEEDYDYLYLEASLDGEDWEILTTPSGTPEDPSGNSYGWGYNGKSGGGPIWILEEVDISQYAGKKVFIRFEYVTDLAIHREGFLLDDVSVPEAGYFTDFEDGEDGWIGDGFVRIQNILPQTYAVSLISFGSEVFVEQIDLAAGNSVDIPITIDRNTNQVVLVVSGTTRFTRIPTEYHFEIN